MVKMSQEPVAFHLYKNRHFEKLKQTAKQDEDLGASTDEMVKQFRRELLRLANAKIIGRKKYELVVD